MKSLLAPTALVLLVAACGDGATATTIAAAPPATAAPETTTPPSETAAATTTSTAPAQTTPSTTVPPPADAFPAFALTQVVFGDNGYVAVTNVGDGPGDPGGHWLCQRPLYFEIPSTPLEPGETVWVAAGDGADLEGSLGPSVTAVVSASGTLGTFKQDTGEIGLYRTGDFGSSDAIVHYVEWGEPGHGRAGVAVTAGIWPDGGFVEVPEGAVAISAAVPRAADPEDWSPDIGV